MYWDNQSIFMEHRFIGGTDGFIHCIALCRQRVMQCSVEDVMATLLKSGLSLQQPSVASAGSTKRTAPTTSSTEFLDKAEAGTCGGTLEPPTSLTKPDLPPEVSKWLEWNEISSASLRSEG